MSIAESIAIDKGTLKGKHISDGWFMMDRTFHGAAAST